jgi:hypothetical protein
MSCAPLSLAGFQTSIIGRFWVSTEAPKHRVSLRRIKLPSMFSHAYGGVSEMNVTCDIYSDDFGLEYWVLSDDFQSYRKGDLLMIRYGLSRAAKRGIPPRTEPK